LSSTSAETAQNSGFIMARYPVYPPYWPPPNPETEAAIGRFVIAWGLLEIQIDEAIGDLLCSSHTLQSSITANLGTKSKIEIFLSIFHIESDFFPTDMLEKVNKLGHDTATAAGVYRVWVAHGAPFRFGNEEIDQEDGESKEWIWAKFSARKGGVKGSMALFTKEIFDKYTDSVRDLITRWHELRITMSPRVGAIEYARKSEDSFN
jgi:hypothetical protein